MGRVNSTDFRQLAGHLPGLAYYHKDPEVAYGQDIALGVLGGGLVMFLSFVGGGWAVHRVGQAAEQGFQRGAAALVVLKLPILFAALWMLFQRFDPIAVVVGGSAVMLSIVLSAVFEMANPIRKEA